MLFLLPQFFPGPSISQLYVLFLPLFRIKMKNPYTIWVISILSYLIGFIVFYVSQLGLVLSLQGLTFLLPASACLAKDPGRKGDDGFSGVDGFSWANGYRASGGCLRIAPVIRTKHFLSGPSAAF